MRLLLLGANGQVGHALRTALAPLGELVCTTRSGTLADGTPAERADLDDPASLPPLVARLAPDVVVNAAAYTAVDRAEQEPAIAFRANAEAPGALAEACARSGALLVHYSTDYVFDGTATQPYREGDATSPLGVYGESKLAGEHAVRAAGGRNLVLRTAWVYGAHGQNFMRTMLRLAAERDELRVVGDQVGTPTSARLIAAATARALQAVPGSSGLYHLTAVGRTSWHGFAEAIVAGAYARGLLKAMPRVTAITTSDYPTPARRPAWSCLDTAAFSAAFGIALPDWRHALDAVLDEMVASAS
ncbi:dTDP-4-dehydrorhamnose reductase [Luteimonas sp. MC1572]|uniref:dTDP-4-dehydrorhamnose reductase n=1 Tax=Luteimonas sp. MC1572 TaxID=2799325 RepID=UPI0018F0C6CB|nr:dTDP-4-dehydrorhamnose reductase [Luteimonas sp. MC1572]MBJ6982582.1 dTDP-4-dehydrorhamnose reductase [Luteimonas sp. MC1572]QQO03831.1 dTDP-4-dehydrorhamnose reductase [Luteimonas sp. MC1572]